MKIQANSLQQVKQACNQGSNTKNTLNKYIKSLSKSNNMLKTIYKSLKNLETSVKGSKQITKTFEYDQYKDTHTLDIIKDNMLLCIELQELIDFINIQKERENRSKKIRRTAMFKQIIDTYKNPVSKNTETGKKAEPKVQDRPFSKRNIDTFFYLLNTNIILRGVLKNRFYESTDTMNLSYPDVIKCVERIENMLVDFIQIFILKKLPNFFGLFHNKPYLTDKNETGGFLYLIGLLETLDNIYIQLVSTTDTEISEIDEEILKNQKIKFSKNQYGIYFDYCERVNFFQINTSNNEIKNKEAEKKEVEEFKIPISDIPEIIKCYKPMFLKNVVIKTTIKNLKELLPTLTFREIIEKIKQIQKFTVHKDLKLIYLNEIHTYLSEILIRNIKANEILGLFEFNTEYIKILENTSQKNYVTVYGRDLVTNQKSQLLKRYVESVQTKMHEWLDNIYCSISEKFNNRVPINSMNSENRLVLSEFISVSNIINEQIEPCTFNAEIVENVANIICAECDVFKNRLLKMYRNEITNKQESEDKTDHGFFNAFDPFKQTTNQKRSTSLIENIYEKNQQNEIRAGFEEYLIATINSSLSIMEICNTLPQIFEIQLLSDVFNSLMNKCLELLAINICALFYYPYKNKGGKYHKNILPSFSEDQTLLKKVPPTVKDFFNDYLEVLNSTSFDNLFMSTTKQLDEVYFKQFLTYFPEKVSFETRVTLAIKVIDRDLVFLNNIYSGDLKLVRDFLDSQSLEISCIELKRVQRRFGNVKDLVTLMFQDVEVFRREGFL